MEKKIRKRYKRARASWKRAAATSVKSETSKRRLFTFVASTLATLATLGSVAFGAEPARTPNAEVGRIGERQTGATKPSPSLGSGPERPAAPVLSMEDAHRCAFRVVASSNGSTATQVGSGTTIARLKNEWLGATNAHVVDGCGVFAMQYFGDGRPVCVDAKLVGKWYDSSRGLDFALLAASRSALDAYNPPVAPLAPPERARLDAASPILSVGCPEAREPQAWKGRVTGGFGEVRRFKPAPLQGQSGSGILQFSPETGVYETRALVTYRTDPSALKDADFDSAEGGALEFALLYDALNGGGAKGSGGVPVPRSRTSATLDSTARFPFAPCVATSPSGFETALWRSSDAASKTSGTSRSSDLRSGSDATATKPLLLYFCATWCNKCPPTTALVAEFARKGWPVKILDVDSAEGGRAWRAYGLQVVPSFAFIEIDAAGDWFATLDVWTGGADARRRIERNFAAFKSRDPTRPRPQSPRPTSQAGPKFVPCVAVAESEETAETEEDAASQEEDSTDVDAASQDKKEAESFEEVDAASQNVGSTSDFPEESERSAVGVSNAETNVNDLTEPETAPPLVAEAGAAEPGSGPTLPVELEEARLPAVAVEPVVGGETTSSREFGPDFEPSTAAEALEAFASGWSPFRPGAGGGAASGGSGDVGGSTDSTAGLIGGAIDRAAREKVDALAAELEKAARERIATVAGELESAARAKVGELESAARAKAEALAAEAEKAARAKVGELESAARAKAEALAAEAEKAARTKVGELESAARLKLDAAAVAIETAATAKLETAVDGLKRRAGAALAAVGVWGAFAAGAWYWLVRGLAKCWGSAPKYRLVRDDGTPQAGQ